MEKSTQSNFSKYFKLEFSSENTIWLSNGYTLRMLIGVLGMAMPLLLYLSLLIASGHNRPLDSISHYYFTRVAGIFIIIIGTLSIFLIVYKGKKPIDFIISSTAGVFALCVLLFPTSNISNICCDPDKNYSVTILQISKIREIFHYTSAGIFLMCLAFMSIFLFTKSNKTPKERSSDKITRNRIYRTCGVIMVAAVLVILAGFLKIIPRGFYEKHHLTFWMETVAVESFGFSWLIKGDTFFKDKN